MEIYINVRYIFIARKRSLGQGNIFTPVCHSVQRGVCVVAPGGAWLLLGGHVWLLWGAACVGYDEIPRYNQ